MLSDFGFEFWAVLCESRSWTQWSVWVPDSSGSFVVLWYPSVSWWLFLLWRTALTVLKAQSPQDSAFWCCHRHLSCSGFPESALSLQRQQNLPSVISQVATQVQHQWLLIPFCTERSLELQQCLLAVLLRFTKLSWSACSDGHGHCCHGLKAGPLELSVKSCAQHKVPSHTKLSPAASDAQVQGLRLWSMTLTCGDSHKLRNAWEASYYLPPWVKWGSAFLSLCHCMRQPGSEETSAIGGKLYMAWCFPFKIGYSTSSVLCTQSSQQVSLKEDQVSSSVAGKKMTLGMHCGWRCCFA